MSQTTKGGALALGVKRPIGMGMIVAAAVVFGLISLTKLPVDLLPPVNYPSLTVRTTYDGAAPEDIEERVTERLEDVLSTVGRLVRISSSSRAEVSEILMEFEWGSNLPFLVQDVRERLDRVFLPPGVDKPLILRYDPSLDPVLRLALSGGKDLVRLRDLAEQEIERSLEGLTGVAAVRVKGGLEDEVQVLVDMARLAQFQITPEMLQQRLEQENLNVPGGKLLEGSVEYVVRTLNQFKTLKEIEELPILRRGQTTIKLKDLAKVQRTHKDRDVIQRVAGEEAVEIAVYREAGANIVNVAEAVRNKLFGKPQSRFAQPQGDGEGSARTALTIQDRLPSNVHLTMLSDQSTFVSNAIREVNSAAMYGGLFAVLICYFFLRRFAATFIIGLAVPISIVATFGAMYNAGVSLNIMSLGGLALGIGMLVDNAIVVLESITRCREEGDDPMTAAVRGVSEVGGAVIASTLTTIAVFAPIIFVEGIAGQTFGDQALTVVASLSISLAVALFFIPGLAARVRLSETASPIASMRTHSRQLAPFSRSRKLIHGLGFSKRWWAWGVAVVAAIFGLYLLYALLPTLDDEWLGVGQQAPDGWSPVPPEVQRQMAGLKWFANLFFLPLLWVLGLPLLTLASRLTYDLISLLLFVLKSLFAALFGVLWAVLYLPTMLFQLVFRGLDALYPMVLRGALKGAPLVLLAALAIGFFVFRGTNTMGRELLPEVLQGELSAELFYPAGTPLTKTDELATRLEAKVRALPGVAETTVSSGADRETVSTEETGPHTAVVSLRLEPTLADGHQREREVERALRDILQGEPELARYSITRPTLLALNAPLEVEVIGDDLVRIGEVARLVESELRATPGLNDVRSSLRRGNPEVRISLDREKLSRHGLTAQEVANRLRLAVEGATSSTFPGRDERIDIRVRADFSTMESIEQLREIPVNPDSPQPIPLGAIATFHLEDGPSDIRHIGSRRAAVLSASLADFDLGATSDAVRTSMQRVERPPDITLSIGGQTDEMTEALDSLSFALLLAIFLVYAVMAAQFESLLQPFLILFSVPLAGVGAVLMMQWTNTPLSVIALLGAVILAGIVVNNAIVLVDRINRNRQKGLSVEEAILEGGRARLRPILMTTTTTVLGMLPMTGWIPFLGGEQGAELRTPMALVVIAGLVSSTMLTLVVIPAGYRLLTYLERKPSHA